MTAIDPKQPFAMRSNDVGQRRILDEARMKKNPEISVELRPGEFESRWFMRH